MEAPVRMADKAKDRGYAWVVLPCCVFILTIHSGTIAMYGILLPEYVEHFGISKAQATAPQSLAFGAILISGFPVGWLVRRFGYQKMTIAGAAVGALGFIVTSFIDSFYFMYFTYGFVPGCSLAVYMVCCVVCVTSYFERRKGLALSVMAGGSGMGFFIWSPIIRALVTSYGRCGTLLLFSGAHLHVLVVAALLRPYPKSTQSEGQKKSLPRKYSFDHRRKSSIFQLPKFDKTWNGLLSLQNVQISLFMVASSLTFSGHVMPYFFLPARAQSLGISKSNSAILLSILGILNTINRPIYGFLADKIGKHRTALFAICAIANGTLTTSSFEMASFIPLAVYAGLHGTLGGYNALYSTVMSDLVPPAKIPLGSGILTMCTDGSIVIVTPIAGWLVDHSCTFSSPFLVFGIVQAVGGCCVLVVYVLQRYGQQQPRGGPEGMEMGEQHPYSIKSHLEEPPGVGAEGVEEDGEGVLKEQQEQHLDVATTR